MEQIIFLKDPLAEIATASTNQEKLAIAHRVLQQRCSGVDRIGVALYDQKSRLLKTFVASPTDQSPLQNYEAVLDEDSSLLDVASSGQTRIVHDMNVFAEGRHEHTRQIIGHGFASSYTYPMLEKGDLLGFIFFNSLHKCYFRERVQEQAEIFAHVIAGIIMSDLAAMQALTAALRTAIGMVHMRDPETGNHLERMARYSRLIAMELAQQRTYPLDDEQITQIYNFAPLHDVGKIGIPDSILLKPSRLETDERQMMSSHTTIGRQIVDNLIDNFGFSRLPYIDYLRQITEHHHEAMDGSGYPHGLKGNAIPLEARIVAVSDVFDALTTQRPYKESWTNNHAFAMLQMLSIDKLDLDCVMALNRRRWDVEKIQEGFVDVVEVEA